MAKIRDQYNKYIVIVNYNRNSHEEVQKILEDTKYILRTKTINNNDIELVLEVDLKTDKSTFVNQISAVKDVRNVSLVNYKSGF